ALNVQLGEADAIQIQARRSHPLRATRYRAIVVMRPVSLPQGIPPTVRSQIERDLRLLAPQGVGYHLDISRVVQFDVRHQPREIIAPRFVGHNAAIWPDKLRQNQRKEPDVRAAINNPVARTNDVEHRGDDLRLRCAGRRNGIPQHKVRPMRRIEFHLERDSLVAIVEGDGEDVGHRFGTATTATDVILADSTLPQSNNKSLNTAIS